jgi:DNA-binding CsgD family transcriptional regulator
MTPTAPRITSATATTTASDEQVLTAVAEILDDSRWCAHLERVATLSHRELDILIQLGSGASNSTIVRRLGITEHTVKAHIGRILAKLRLESRLQAGLVGYLWALSAQPAR